MEVSRSNICLFSFLWTTRAGKIALQVPEEGLGSVGRTEGRMG